MNKEKKRHPLACKCCTYDGGGDPSGKYAVRMIQLPVVKATTVHIPVILGAILLGPWQVPSWEECSVSVLW